MQYYDGHTTEFVPPVKLESGEYTQIRIVVSEATIGINENNETTGYTVTIPSQNLKTDKSFNFDVENDGAVHITVDFDLSQSIVVTDDGSGILSYKLKPVLHIVDTVESPTITGMIENICLFNEQDALVKVLECFGDDDDADSWSCETYTELNVSKDTSGETTVFSIFWLLSNRSYRVEIYFDGDGNKDFNWMEDVFAESLNSDKDFYLNQENTIDCQD
jgi:hypothetical protein